MKINSILKWGRYVFPSKKTLLIITISAFFLITNFLITGASNVPNEASQKEIITGTITDITTGEPIIGANIVVKGTTIGVMSDADGKFSIEVPAPDAEIVISYIGYISETLVLKGQNNNIKLAPDITKLDEIVVVGYGTTKKRDISTSIASISSDKLSDRVVTGFNQAIAGKLPGVRVSSTNAAPGGGQSIIIRGIGSINASAAPLYVVDGMPLPDTYNKNEDPINFINTNDIESIEVLKDASATAIYGARASNGVILVTTKRGKKGKPTVNLTASRGVESMMKKMELLSRDEFNQYLEDSRSQAYILEDPYLWDDNRRSWSWNDPYDVRIANWTARNASTNIVGDPKRQRWITVIDEVKNNPNYVDWQDEITRPGVIQEYQLSANGGNESVTYMVSGGYYDQEGLVKSSGYKRFTARANVDLKINKNLKFGINLAPSFETFDRLDRQEGGEGSNSIFWAAITLPPIYTPYDQNGKISYFGTNVTSPYDYNFDSWVNPYSSFQISDISRKMKNITSIYGELTILKGLTFRSEFHSEYSNRIWEYFMPSVVHDRALPYSRSQGSGDRSTRTTWNTQNLLTYTNTFNKHSITSVIGYQSEKIVNRGMFITKYNYMVDELSTLNFSSTLDDLIDGAKTSEYEVSMIGMFGRAMYNYNRKYYLTASVRRDGSSKFGEENRWGIFPSFSLAWRISDEKFMQPLEKVISDMKIRGGWGKVGNSGIGDYQALNRLSLSDYSLGAGTSGTFIAGTSDAGIAYTGLGWESTEDFDIGADIQLFGGRINIEYDYYIRNTTDMLFSVPLMQHSGFSSQVRNTCSMQNKGMEFRINTQILTGAFNWSTDLNLYYNRNKVTNLGPEKNPIYSGPGNVNRTDVDKPLANMWGYVYLGPYRDWEDVKTSPIINANQAAKNRSIPGDPKCADVNADGIIDANDQTTIGNAEPDFVWGINNRFSYRNFDLNIQVNGVQGGQTMAYMFRSVVFGNNQGRSNIPKFYFDNYWRPDRPDAKYEVPTRKAYSRTVATNSNLVYDASFINISNLNFGYTLPKKWAETIRLQNARIYLSISNLYMFTRYPGFNPEVNSSGLSALSQGIDQNTYPIARTVSLGVNITF